MKQITKRLQSGQDVREEIEKLVQQENIKAGVILSLVGSLDKVSLRYAGRKGADSFDQAIASYEIVSATGTLSSDGCHIHIAVSDERGQTKGGHLVKGCRIRTTTELVVLVFEDVEYKRLLDKKTGFDELEVQ